MDKEIKAILGVVGGIIVTVGGVVLHMLMGPPERDSEEWIENLSDDEWKKKEKEYAWITVILI